MIRTRGVRFDPERTEVRVLLRDAPLRGARVLDVGCGDGRLTRRIARFSRSVAGIDPDPDQISRARAFTSRLLRRVRYEVAAAEAIPFGPRSFDVVLFSSSL
jgi:2-polyprenyl-3-methyl-5-hydroxy-6-metoxy-1,4-benzoquinol methylase